MIELPNGSLWVGTSDKGVWRYRDEEGWDPVPASLKQASLRMGGFAISPSGGVWVLGLSARIRVIDRPDLPDGWKVVEELSDWQGVPSALSDLIEESGGSLWIASQSGVIRKPAEVRRGRIEPPRVRLAGLIMNGERVDLSSLAQVPPGHNQLEIQFAALTYRDRSLLKYQYRLHSNDEWTDSASNLPVFRFFDLSSGKYTAEVRASLDGVSWSAETARINFEVMPYWYLRWWVISLFAVAVSIALYAAHRTRVAGLLRLERQRTRIAMDLHDEIGSGLGSIGILSSIASGEVDESQRQELTRQIADTASELGSSLTDIVWSLRRESATLEGLAYHLTRRAGRLFSNGASFNFATGEPLLLARGTWVQPASHIESGRRIWEVWLLNSDSGRPWRKVYSGPDGQAIAFPASAGLASDPVVYYSLFRGGATAAIYKLLRISRFLEPTSLATHAEPAMQGCPAGSPGFGGLGTVPTMWAWYQVFAVDPGNAAHLIAPDAINGGMKKSTNGGECWEDMPELTRLVTRSGQLRFAPALDFGPGLKLPATLVSAISFYPENPNYVILGTIEGGLFYSSDGGETWIELSNSAQVKPVTGFYWLSPTSIYVATYGRGLWQATAISRSRVSLGDLASFEWCPQPCFREPYLPPPDDRPRDFDSAFFVYDGAISDAKAENKSLVSVALTPGTVAFHFESEQAKRVSLPIRFAPQTGEFEGLPEVRKLATSGRIIRGFTFRQGAIHDIIYGSTVARLSMPKPRSSMFQSSARQIAPQGPRVDLLATTMQGFYPVLFGEGQIKILGNNFRGIANRPVQIQIDGQVILRNVAVDSKGSFKTSIKVNRPEGWHTLTAIQRVDPNQVLRNGNLFIVRHLDKK